MARFALFSNGVKVETLDELKENFNITDMLENYRNKALHRWLMVNRMTGELSQIEAITATEDNAVIDELVKIFEVPAETIEKQKRVLEEKAQKKEEVLSQLERELLTDIERSDFLKYMDDASDPQNVIALLRKHAEHGNPVAQLKLGYCFENEKGVEKDLELAVEWYKKSAEQGLARAQNHLGYCFRCGKGVTKDEEQAVFWYRKSADQNFHLGLLNLGTCYEYGIGVEKDLTVAVNFYKKAVELKNHRAEYYLAYCYDKGIGIEKNEEEARRLYHIAADAGDALAQNSLGIKCEFGVGAEEQDVVKALEWYRKSAQQSFHYAQFNFFKLWFKIMTDSNDDNEQLLLKNAEDAIHFLSLANNGKNDEAKAWYTTICLIMTDDAPENIKKYLSPMKEDDGIALLKSLDIDSNELQVCLGVIYTTIYGNGSSTYLSGIHMLQASKDQSEIAKNILDKLPDFDISNIEISLERFSSNILFNGRIKTLGEYFISISNSSVRGDFVVRSKDGKIWEEFHEVNSGFNYADYVTIYSLVSANNRLFVFSNQKIVEIDEKLDVSFHDNSICGDQFNECYVDITHNGDQYVIKAKVDRKTTIYRVRDLSFYVTFQKEWFENEDYEMHQLQYFKGKYYGTTYLNGQRNVVVSDDGSHFSALTTIPQDNYDHKIYRFDDILFITGENNTYYTKDGENWESPYSFVNLRDIRKSNNFYYARASFDIYISNDGANWHKICSVDDQYNFFEVNSLDKILLYDLAMPGSTCHLENRYLSGEIR